MRQSNFPPLLHPPKAGGLLSRSRSLANAASNSPRFVSQFVLYFSLVTSRYFHHHWQCLSGLTIVMVTTITILTTAILRSCTATSPVFLLRIRISVCFNFSYFSLIIFTTIIITTYNCSVCHRLAVASETNICDKKLLRFWNDWEGNSVTSTLKYTCIVLH